MKGIQNYEELHVAAQKLQEKELNNEEMTEEDFKILFLYSIVQEVNNV